MLEVLKARNRNGGVQHSEAIRVYLLSHPNICMKVIFARAGITDAEITDAISNTTLIHEISLSNEEDPFNTPSSISIKCYNLLNLILQSQNYNSHNLHL